MLTMIGYKKCSTCRKALKFLDEKGCHVTFRDYTEQPLTRDELLHLHEQSGEPIKKIFNTSGVIYREMHLKDKLDSMSLDDKITLLSEHAMLVKRPILVTNNIVLIGFNEEKWSTALNI